jgi:tRNA(His) guanylyltransferase
VAEKNELLFQHGINFNDVPAWQKRGSGLHWEEFDKPSINPITGQEVIARRRRIRRNLGLPMKDAYGDFIRGVIESEKRSRGRSMQLTLKWSRWLPQELPLRHLGF